MALMKKKNASGGDIYRQKKRGRVFTAPPYGETRKCASPGTAIGVPACTVFTYCRIIVNKPLLLLALNIPAGGILLLVQGFKHA